MRVRVCVCACVCVCVGFGFYGSRLGLGATRILHQYSRAYANAGHTGSETSLSKMVLFFRPAPAVFARCRGLILSLRALSLSALLRVCPSHLWRRGAAEIKKARDQKEGKKEEAQGRQQQEGAAQRQRAHRAKKSGRLMIPTRHGPVCACRAVPSLPMCCFCFLPSPSPSRTRFLWACFFFCNIYQQQPTIRTSWQSAGRRFC